DASGNYRMVVNAGGGLRVQLEGGVSPVQRDVNGRAGYLTVDKVVLTPRSTVAAPVTLGDTTPTMADLGTTHESDCTDPGTGQAVQCNRANTLFVPKGTLATEVLPDRTTHPLSGHSDV